MSIDIQTLLIFVLGILTINLIIVGVYIILVLKEFRETVKKANYVLDNVNGFADAVANPISTIAGIISGVTESVKAVKQISSLIETNEKKEEKKKHE